MHSVGETAGRQRPAVSFYVGGFAVAASLCFAWVSYRDGMPLSWALLVFAILAAVADVREVRLPGVGHVGMSFVPVLAALAILGLWPAMVVAAVSGAADIGVTKDPQKIVFDIANCVLSTFVAGLVYVELVPAGAGFVEMVIPAFLATALDFLVSTVGVAGVIALSTGDGPVAVWRKNYQWALPGYLAGATFALLAVWLYGLLGVAGLVLAVPPVVFIYYSYEVYVSRARDRVSFDAERDSFQEELTKSTELHEELRSAQLKVAAEIERARRIQADLLPTATPDLQGLRLAQRMEFLGEMGGDYYDYIPFGDGRIGIVCGDVMGKGLAAALIMAMARSLLHTAIAPDKGPGEVLAEVNDGLARDLEGQRLPYFLTMALAVYDPQRRSLAIAGGGHNPVLIAGTGGVRQVPSRGAALGVRTGLQFPEDEIELSAGDTVALYTDGLTEARDPEGRLFGLERLESALERCHRRPLDETLASVWGDVAAFRAASSPGDDATLLLARLA
ncbi:PP2C family protein-serine/threonine phosphatase [Zavarzinia sp.]|uniref:PP2C family protein-serine/threonine phosphatase n=1 Tax=Zavarzinia sp. TaxID=2027920 RepID=UPI003564F25C